MKIKNRQSVLARLILIGMAEMLFLLAAFIITNNQTRNILKGNTLEYENRLMLQMEQRFDEFDQNLTRIATSMSYSPTIYEYFSQDFLNRVIYMENVSTVFSNTILLENTISDIFLFDRNMELIASMGKESQILEKEEAVYVSKSEMGYSNLLRSEYSNVPYYLFYFPVFNLNSKIYGQQIGTCVIAMKTENFTAMLEGAQATEHTQVYLLDGNCQVVASMGAQNQEQTDPEDLMNSGEFQVSIHNLAIGDWRLVSAIPNKELSVDTFQTSKYITSAYLMAVIFLGVLIWICYMHLVVPVRKLERFVTQVPVSPDKRLEVKLQDEIGAVEQALNQMLDSIQQQSLEIQQAKDKAHRAELAEKQLQILAYRNQINPHFLYNTLDCIRAMALINDQDHIAEITMALSKVFRFAIKGSSIVCVEDEINYIKEYAKIIDYRFGGRIRVLTEVEDAARSKSMIKLILQPLIENAVFHGLEKKIEGGQVKASVQISDTDKLLFLVEDDGCGMSLDVLENLKQSLNNEECRKGIGISNIYQRLKLFYEDEIEFSIESREHVGTRIMIQIPDKPTNGGIEYV